MIAYNKTALYNIYIHENVDEAVRHNVVTGAAADAIKKSYPLSLYSPNLFIRIGLFVLTIVVLLFSFGLLALLFMSNIEHSITGLAIFFSLLTYAALEFFIHAKKHYRSGVDDALLWGASATFFCAISFAWLSTGSNLAICLLVFFISLYAVLRFADWLMAALASLSLCGIIFFSVTATGSTGKAIAPFVIMAFAALLYFLVKKMQQPKRLPCYMTCLAVAETVALLILYAAGNYFVVRELSNEMFGLSLTRGQDIPLGWLFWIFTVIVPLIYIYTGIKKKNAILLRTGLLLVAAMVFTIRYYHTVLSVEIAMTIGGTALIIIAWALTRYLQAPRYGFTYQEQDTHDAAVKLNIEALIIAETFSQQPGPVNKTEFGGGGFGGGGASGEY